MLTFLSNAKTGVRLGRNEMLLYEYEFVLIKYSVGRVFYEERDIHLPSIDSALISSTINKLMQAY